MFVSELFVWAFYFFLTLQVICLYIMVLEFISSCFVGFLFVQMCVSLHKHVFLCLSFGSLFPAHLFVLSYLALFVFIQPYHCCCFNACWFSNERKQRVWIWVGEEDLGRAGRGETVINIYCMENIYFQ